MGEQFGARGGDPSLVLETYATKEEWYFAESIRGLCATAQVCRCGDAAQITIRSICHGCILAYPTLRLDLHRFCRGCVRCEAIA